MGVFGRKKKKAAEKDKSVADALGDQIASIDEQLMRLEESRARGEIDDEKYYEMRERLEALKKSMEDMTR